MTHSENPSIQERRSNTVAPAAGPKTAWTRDAAQILHDLPLSDLVFRAQTILRENFDPNAVQTSQLLSVKTGGCAENCGYCSQSAFAESGLKASKLKASKLMDPADVIAQAKTAKAGGAGRFCMGAAWRDMKDRDMDKVTEMIAGVKALGLETCGTFGMLNEDQAKGLKEAGLDYYNHNLDTSESHYKEVITTRTYQERLDTIQKVRNVGMKVCCGGIMGLGEQVEDRLDMLVTLANMETPPESVPINSLVPIPGTRLQYSDPVDPIEFVRVIAVARIMMPTSYVRLSAGRDEMSLEMQALCFLAGANSFFVGDTMLTTPNPGEHKDGAMMAALGLYNETDKTKMEVAE